MNKWLDELKKKGHNLPAHYSWDEIHSIFYRLIAIAENGCMCAKRTISDDADNKPHESVCPYSDEWSPE